MASGLASSMPISSTTSPTRAAANLTVRSSALFAGSHVAITSPATKSSSTRPDARPSEYFCDSGRATVHGDAAAHKVCDRLGGGRSTSKLARGAARVVVGEHHAPNLLHPLLPRPQFTFTSAVDHLREGLPFLPGMPTTSMWGRALARLSRSRAIDMHRAGTTVRNAAARARDRPTLIVAIFMCVERCRRLVWCWGHRPNKTTPQRCGSQSVNPTRVPPS